MASGCGPLRRATKWFFLRRRNEKIGGYTEASPQPLDHRHAQSLFTAKDFANAAWCAEDRHHVRARETVLVHQVADQIGDPRRAARPFAFLIGDNQARLG